MDDSPLGCSESFWNAPCATCGVKFGNTCGACEECSEKRRRCGPHEPQAQHSVRFGSLESALLLGLSVIEGLCAAILFAVWVVRVLLNRLGHANVGDNSPLLQPATGDFFPALVLVGLLIAWKTRAG